MGHLFLAIIRMSKYREVTNFPGGIWLEKKRIISAIKIWLVAVVFSLFFATSSKDWIIICTFLFAFIFIPFINCEMNLASSKKIIVILGSVVISLCCLLCFSVERTVLATYLICCAILVTVSGLKSYICKKT